jgi:hypothetical protein
VAHAYQLVVCRAVIPVIAGSDLGSSFTLVDAPEAGPLVSRSRRLFLCACLTTCEVFVRP